MACITFDTRSVRQQLLALCICFYPKCLNCGEELNYIPVSYNYPVIEDNKVINLVRTTNQWVHSGYANHPDCPLYSDIKLRPYTPLSARVV